ncbi:unnamed protein product [Brassica oleracea var. botrytis]
MLGLGRRAIRVSTLRLSPFKSLPTRLSLKRLPTRLSLKLRVINCRKDNQVNYRSR